MDGHQHPNNHPQQQQREQQQQQQQQPQQDQHPQPYQGRDVNHSLNPQQRMEPPRQLLAYVTGGNQCQNCQTTQTCMWRRGGESGDMLLCNKCGLYYTRKGYHRPQLNRKPTVRRRTTTRRTAVVDSGQNPGTAGDTLSVPSSSSTPSPSSLAYHQLRPITNVIQKPERMTMELLPHYHQQQTQAHHSLSAMQSYPVKASSSSSSTSTTMEEPKQKGNNSGSSGGASGDSVVLSVTREQAQELLRGIQKAVGLTGQQQKQEKQEKHQPQNDEH